MNIFNALREDHDTQRILIDSLVTTEGDSNARELLFQQIKVELQAHAVAEERHFYAPLMGHDLTQEKSRHSIAEHHKIDKSIDKLESTDYSSPAWLVEAKQLQHLIHHHLKEEEHEVFQLGGKALKANEKQSLANDYIQEMKEQREILTSK